MALLITIDDKPVFLPAVQANLLWQIFTGERTGSPKTKAKVKRIKRFYLNRETAPASYLQAHPTDTAVADAPAPVQARLPYAD